MLSVALSLNSVPSFRVRPASYKGRGRAYAGSNDNGECNQTRREISIDYAKEIEEAEQLYMKELEGRKSRLELFSPSKINLFLRVTQRREDGFHDLASLFHAIDLGDTMRFSFSPSNERDSLTTNSPDVPLDDSNLVIRALNLFREKTGIKQYFWVDLQKQVPTGAGLGGGSGNGATALWAANEMTGRPVKEEELLEWSVEVGSDCPFFFSTGAAYCTSKGEDVRNIPPPLSLNTEMLLVKPPEGLATGPIFKALNLSPGETFSGLNPEELLVRLQKEGPSNINCINDLQIPAFLQLPRLDILKKRLISSGLYQAVFMTGSGSTLVCIGSEELPSFLEDDNDCEDLFISPARLITRQPGKWYQPDILRQGNAENEREFIS